MLGLIWVRSNTETIFLLDDDEAQRKEKRRVAPPQEENVYYISLEEIQKRKIRVSDLPAFVADKTMAYYEDEFDVSLKPLIILYYKFPTVSVVKLWSWF